MKRLTGILFVALIIAVTFMFTACTSAIQKENAEKQAAIVGAWIVADGSDVGQNDSGETYVNVYEFTADGRQNYHQVKSSGTTTYPMPKYEIYDGKLKVNTKSGTQLAEISFDGDLMTMGSSTAKRVYRKLTDEELKTYNIKLGIDPDQMYEDANKPASDTSAMEESSSETASESISE
jgi:hypothetical protein